MACSTSKKFSDYQQFRFELKLKVLFIKSFEKIEVYDFCLKKCVNFCQTRSIFWTIIQDMLKITLLPWDQHHFLKSQEFFMSLALWYRGGKSIQLAQIYIETLFLAPRDLMGILKPNLRCR